MSASSYFSYRFPAMWVVLVESAPICTVFTGTWSRLGRLDLGSLCRRLGLRGGWILLGTCSLCRQSMQSLRPNTRNEQWP